MKTCELDEIEAEIDGRLFVLGARCTGLDDGSIDVEFTTLDEAPATPGSETPYGLATAVEEPERSALLEKYAAVFRDAVLDRLQAEAERADERRAEGP